MRFFLFLLLPFVANCGSVLECSLRNDNVEGRIVYAANIPISTKFRIEWSTDGFTTTTGGKTIQNYNALPTFPYSACVITNLDLSFRAYQDTNGNNQLDAGEASGRFDGTDNGHGAFLTRNIPNVTGTDIWEIVRDVHITVDTP